MAIHVDIILISFNQRRYIERAIESIFVQIADAHVKLIIADDCSTDGTAEIIKYAMNKSPFEVLFLEQEKNMGISRNYQRAFKACDGDYIAILEGDDYWCSPYHLQQHIIFMEKYPNCPLSMNAITYLDDNSGKISGPTWWYPSSPYFVDYKEQIEAGNQLGNLSACVLRTSCVKKLPDEMFELSVADWMLGVMLSQQGPLGLLQESTSVYRKNTNSSWASKSHFSQLMTEYRLSLEYDIFQRCKYHGLWVTFRRRVLKEGWHIIKRKIHCFIGR